MDSREKEPRRFLTVTLPAELHERLKVVAAEQYRSVNSVIAQACDVYCNVHFREEASEAEAK